MRAAEPRRDPRAGPGTVSPGCPPCVPRVSLVSLPPHPAQALTTGPASRASSTHSCRAPAGRRRRALRRHRAAAIAAATPATPARLMGTARPPPPPGPRGCGRGGTARHSMARYGSVRQLRAPGRGWDREQEPHGRVSAAGQSPHTRVGAQSPSRAFWGLGIPCWRWWFGDLLCKGQGTSPDCSAASGGLLLAGSGMEMP